MQLPFFLTLKGILSMQPNITASTSAQITVFFPRPSCTSIDNSTVYLANSDPINSTEAHHFGTQLKPLAQQIESLNIYRLFDSHESLV